MNDEISSRTSALQNAYTRWAWSMRRAGKLLPCDQPMPDPTECYRAIDPALPTGVRKTYRDAEGIRELMPESAAWGKVQPRLVVTSA